MQREKPDYILATLDCKNHLDDHYNWCHLQQTQRLDGVTPYFVLSQTKKKKKRLRGGKP